MDLLLQKSRYLHPAYAAHVVPMREWACRVYDAEINSTCDRKNRVSRMREAFNTQQAASDTEQCAWQQVKGPATALMATMRRIKWQPIAHDRWVTDTGEELDLKKTIPYLVGMKVREAVERWLW